MDTIKGMVVKAVHLAWNMITLVPPAIICQPTEYKEEWHEKQFTSWNKDLSDNPVVYFEPLLFYSSRGHVQCKGIIGNTQTSNMTLATCHSTLSNEVNR